MEIKSITKSFGDKRVLTGVTYKFMPAATTGITGASGNGKTTLVNIILGLITPDSGEVCIEADARLACVFQEDRLIEHYDAHKNVKLTAHRSVRPGDIADALAELGIDPRDETKVSAYSGGMRRRVAIVRAVLARPDILILDEPFKGLDIPTRATAARFIMKSCPYATRIIVTHDPDELCLMAAENILCLDESKK